MAQTEALPGTAAPLMAELAAHSSHRLAAAQEHFASRIAALIDEVMLSLELPDQSQDGEMPGDLPMPANTGGITPAALSSMMGSARRRASHAMERRQLAEDMVFSALRNLDQPGWNTDAAHDAGGEGAFLQALLQWQRPG